MIKGFGAGAKKFGGSNSKVGKEVTDAMSKQKSTKTKIMIDSDLESDFEDVEVDALAVREEMRAKRPKGNQVR